MHNFESGNKRFPSQNLFVQKLPGNVTVTNVPGRPFVPVQAAEPPGIVEPHDPTVVEFKVNMIVFAGFCGCRHHSKAP